MRLLLILVCVPSILTAAPPSLTTLSPVGAQSGATSTITVSGTFDPWPVQAIASIKGIDFKPAKDKGKFTVAIAKDVPAGLYWICLYRAAAASEQRPFFVS